MKTETPCLIRIPHPTTSTYPAMVTRRSSTTDTSTTSTMGTATTSTATTSTSTSRSHGPLVRHQRTNSPADGVEARYGPTPAEEFVGGSVMRRLLL